MLFQILDWDSNFFGFRTAKILPPQLSQHQITRALDELRLEGVRLAYWASQGKPPYNLKHLGGYLVDKKVTFQVNLKKLAPEDFISTHQVEKYQPGMPEEDLYQLALQAGEFSRFALDPHFPPGKFQALYREWMRKSLNKEIAEEILVIQNEGRIAGMVTLGKKGSQGNIGLIAVSSAFRGQQFGEILIRAAQLWYIQQKLASAVVITQGENKPACQLYHKCNYEIHHTDFIYHFWL